MMSAADTVSLRAAGLHPPNPRTTAELTTDLDAVLHHYGLAPTFW